MGQLKDNLYLLVSIFLGVVLTWYNFYKSEKIMESRDQTLRRWGLTDTQIEHYWGGGTKGKRIARLAFFWFAILWSIFFLYLVYSLT